MLTSNLSNLGRQRQTDLYEPETSSVSIASSRPVKATGETLSQQIWVQIPAPRGARNSIENKNGLKTVVVRLVDALLLHQGGL